MIKNKSMFKDKLIEPIIILFLLVLCFWPRPLFAAPIVDDAFFFEPKNHIEISQKYEHLTPHNVYGNWETLSVKYERKETADFRWSAEASNFNRNTGSAQLGTMQAYKDWSDSFYTYTAVSGGTKSEYLPKVTIDQVFCFKFGTDKRYVWDVGGTYVGYHDDQKDYILSMGLGTYVNRWGVEYHIFRNIRRPGSVKSYSYEFSVSYGKERKQMTKLTYSFGNEAYRKNHLTIPEKINEKSHLMTLNHRRWLAIDNGYYGEISSFKLQNEYRSTGISLGMFREF